MRENGAMAAPGQTPHGHSAAAKGHVSNSPQEPTFASVVIFVAEGQSRPLLHCKISGQDGTLRFIRRALPCPAPSASEAPTLR